MLRAIAKELRQRSPEVEAKVALLVNYGTPDSPFLPNLLTLRLSRACLFALLEEPQPWPDVDWSPSRYMHTRLAWCLLRVAPQYFRREDVDRLHAWAQRDQPQVPLTGNRLYVLGIAQLLPRAMADQLDDLHTYDGVLRAAIRAQGENPGWLAYAAELVRVGLPENWPFLKSQFFTEQHSLYYSDLRWTILDALGSAPHTTAQRAALIDLLLDRRFDPLWTEQSDSHRMAAAQGRSTRMRIRT